MYHKKLIRELCNNEDVALKIKSLLFKIDDLKNDNLN